MSRIMRGGVSRRPWRSLGFHLCPQAYLAAVFLTSSATAFSQVGSSTFDFAVYATGTGCKAISMSGNVSVDSFDSSQGTYAQTKQLSKGIVGTSGNIDLSGNVTINGPIFALNTTVGACQNGTPAISLSGKAQATGGYIQLGAVPPFPSVAIVPPGTTDQRITTNVTLPPGSYGNVAVSGGNTVTLSPGTYNVNSISLSGQSILTMNPVGQVTINVAGNNVSQAIDLTGGSISNPSGVPRNFQLVYGGNLPIALSGGSMAHALLYAPNSDVSLHGGSDWYGAMTVKTLDDSGNVAIHYDRSLAVPPSIESLVTPFPNAAAWNSSNVTVTFFCSDPILGVASCSPPVAVAAEGANHVVKGTAVNQAGFSAGTSVSVNIDKTPPAISGAASPAPNAAGWNNSNVTVTFTCSDALSGIGFCTPPVGVTTEAKNQVVTGTVVDKAGNSTSASVTVSLDKTPPNVAIASPPNGSTIALSTTSIGVAGTDSDTLSGVGGVTCNNVPATIAGSNFTCAVSLTPGSNSISVQAADIAGNSKAANLTLTYAPAPQISISSPINLSVTNISPVTVNGTVSDPNVTVTINGIPVPQSSGMFSMPVPLVEGLNVLAAVAKNASGFSSTASVQVTLDTTPPHITIDSPADGTTTTDASVTVTGIANDVVVGTVNAQDVQVTVNGIAAQVANRTYAAASVPLSVGKNTIQAKGVDRAGNGTTTSINVTRALPSQPPQPAIGQAVITGSLSIISGNNQTGTIGMQLGAPLVVALVDSSNHPVPNQAIVFKVTGNNGIVSAGGAGAAAVTVTTGANGQAQVFWTLGQRSGAGSNKVQVSTALAIGLANFTATGVTSNASLIIADSGNGQTGVIGQPLSFPFVAVVTDSGNNRVSGVPVTFTAKLGGGTFGGLTAQTVTSDSNGRAIAVLTLGLRAGIENNVVEATFPGNTGLPVAFAASARAPGNPANTTISGVVLDNSNNPIQAATMRLFQTNQGNNNNLPIQIGTPVQTNARGTFLIPSAPVGFFKLMADGSTAAGPKSYPTLEYDIVTVAGNDNTVGMPIYLPALDTVNKLCVDATHGGTLKLPQVPGFSLTVAAGSATFPGGSKTGCVSVTPVNGDKVPMAPGFGQQPRFIVTIQPVGTTFNPPAPITIPNADGLKPKAVTEMYSYDHDLSMFIAIGTGTVSNDGSVIASNPGVGVLKAGWHCGGDPNSSGSAASLQVTTDRSTATIAANSSSSITAFGSPPLDGTYSWSIINTAAGDDSGAFALLTAPPCADQANCVATFTGTRPATATLRVTFTCTTTGLSTTADVRVKVARQVSMQVDAYIPFAYVTAELSLQGDCAIDRIFGTVIPRTPPTLDPLLWIVKTLYYHGDSRALGNISGSYRLRQTVTVFVDRVDNMSSPVIGSPVHLVGESKSYAQDPTLTDDSVLEDCFQLHERATASNTGLTIAATWTSDSSVQITAVGEGANPLVFGSPNISYNLNVAVDDSNPSTPTFTLNGSHDCFPGYEVFLNGSSVYGLLPTSSNEIIILGCLSGIGSISPSIGPKSLPNP